MKEKLVVKKIFKKRDLAGVAQCTERRPMNQRVAGSIRRWGTCLGGGTDVLSLLSPLSENKFKNLKKKKKSVTTFQA